MWRAATLEGWRLFNDPNYHHLQGSIKQIVGNPNRDVWKQVCWRLALEVSFEIRGLKNQNKINTFYLLILKQIPNIG